MDEPPAAPEDMAVLLSEVWARRGGALWEQLAGAIMSFRAGRSALQRRIVAPLIVETEARALGGDVVESSGGIPVGEGR